MTVQSVDRVLSIIEFLAKKTHGAGLTIVSNELSLPKSTTHRLLKTLIKRDYVYQNEETEHYFLSFKIAHLSSKIIEDIDLISIARPYIEQLTSNINEVIHLCIRDGNEVVYIDKVESSRTLRMYSQIGKRAMLHCTGVGKILLAGLSDKQFKKIINTFSLVQYTNNTIMSEKALFEEIQNIRKNNYALDREEHEEGIYCISAPIKDYKNNTVAGISISGPVNRIKEAVEHGNYKKDILRTSQLISKKLGYNN